MASESAKEEEARKKKWNLVILCIAHTIPVLVVLIDVHFLGSV
jgi:t-SNARE complex subunit (syntaxin)